MLKIPDRWLPYQAMGKQIPGTRFICFKVPLKEQICKKMEQVKRFTPQNVLDQCPEMKLIVDLTNTNRFYDWKVFEDSGVEYKKIQTPGHVIPPSDFITEFFTAVDAFLSSSTESDSLIGVHCTHGLNRTSYFVCSYMIHRMGVEPQDAITAFEDARGHKIERQNYVDDLLKRGTGSRAVAPNCRATVVNARAHPYQDAAHNWRDRARNVDRRGTTEHPANPQRQRITVNNRQYFNPFHAPNGYQPRNNPPSNRQGLGRHRDYDRNGSNVPNNRSGDHDRSGYNVPNNSSGDYDRSGYNVPNNRSGDYDRCNQWRGNTRSHGSQGPYSWRTTDQGNSASRSAASGANVATSYAEHRKMAAQKKSRITKFS